MCNCSDQWSGDQWSSHHSSLNFETLLSDPMTRMVMESDGVSIAELVKVLERARDAVDRRAAEVILPFAA
jgi:hypothetical protein